MIDKAWMNEYAYQVKTCPRCHKNSFCLIFECNEFGQEWECAESTCGYNPKCAHCNK